MSEVPIAQGRRPPEPTNRHKESFAITRRTLYAPIVEADAELDWEMANSIQITPTELGDKQHHLGIVIARPHATGWFVSARCRHGLDGAEAGTFEQFVATQEYLLLQEGPTRGAWARGNSDEEWHAYAIDHVAV